MSGLSCYCSERAEPIDPAPGANRPARLWRIVKFQHNNSRMNGGRWTASRWSEVCCLRCGAIWRSKSNFVLRLPMATERELNVRPGAAGYDDFMLLLGRNPARGGRGR